MKRVDWEMYRALGLENVSKNLRLHVRDALKFPEALSYNRGGLLSFGLGEGVSLFIHEDLKVHANLKWNEDHR